MKAFCCYSSEQGITMKLYACCSYYFIRKNSLKYSTDPRDTERVS
jgi:hypothetical protein